MSGDADLRSDGGVKSIIGRTMELGPMSSGMVVHQEMKNTTCWEHQLRCVVIYESDLVRVDIRVRGNRYAQSHGG